MLCFVLAELTPEQQKLLIELRRKKQELLLEIQVSLVKEKSNNNKSDLQLNLFFMPYFIPLIFLYVTFGQLANVKAPKAALCSRDGGSSTCSASSSFAARFCRLPLLLRYG